MRAWVIAGVLMVALVGLAFYSGKRVGIAECRAENAEANQKTTQEFKDLEADLLGQVETANKKARDANRRALDTIRRSDDACATAHPPADIIDSVL